MGTSFLAFDQLVSLLIFYPLVGDYDDWAAYRWALFLVLLVASGAPIDMEVPWLLWKLLRRPARSTGWRTRRALLLLFCGYGSSGAAAARARQGLCVLVGQVADEKAVLWMYYATWLYFTHIHNMVCHSMWQMR